MNGREIRLSIEDRLINSDELSRALRASFSEYNDAHINSRPIYDGNTKPIGFTLDEKCFDDAFDALQTNTSYITMKNDFTITFSLPSIIYRPSPAVWNLIKRAIKNTPLGVPAKIHFDSSIQNEINNLMMIFILYESGGVSSSGNLIKNYASDFTRNEAFLTIGDAFHKAILNE